MKLFKPIRMLGRAIETTIVVLIVMFTLANCPFLRHLTIPYKVIFVYGANPNDSFD